MSSLLPLVTRDPATGDQLIVTRLESPSGLSIEGHFDLGWVGRLTPEQLDFVGLLLQHRTNLQKLAEELGIAYNTVRSRLDDVVSAIGGDPAPAREKADAGPILDQVKSGDLSVDEAIAAIRASRDA